MSEAIVNCQYLKECDCEDASSCRSSKRRSNNRRDAGHNGDSSSNNTAFLSPPPEATVPLRLNSNSNPPPLLPKTTTDYVQYCEQQQVDNNISLPVLSLPEEASSTSNYHANLPRLLLSQPPVLQPRFSSLRGNCYW